MLGGLLGIDINEAMNKMAEFHLLFERLVNTLERVEARQELIIAHLGVVDPAALPVIEHSEGE